MTFNKASHTKEWDQICFLVGLIIGEVKKGAAFHILSWSSHGSRRPAKSTAGTEMKAASEAFDADGKYKRVLSKLLLVNVEAIVTSGFLKSIPCAVVQT